MYKNGLFGVYSSFRKFGCLYIVDFCVKKDFLVIQKHQKDILITQKVKANII